MSEGAHIRSYVLEETLARGGMATVFLATDTRTGRKVALKQILPQVASDPEFLDRFRHEVMIHASLHHPNILEVYELEAGPEHYFIAMELAEGGSLKALLERKQGLLPEIALFVAAEMLKGLAAAHASGIIHRDVKPHNILLTRDGGLKVADFGISKTDQMTRLTQTGDLVGTPAYMSPEQATLVPLDPRSDIFSAGVVLYEMLTGVNPFNTGNPVTTLRAVAEREPEPLFEVDPRIPVECELLLEGMLAKNRDRRFTTAAEAATAVEKLLRSFGVSDGTAVFRRFMADGDRLTEGRRRQLSARHLQTGQHLLAAGRASLEVVLWELYQAHVLDPGNLEAKTLVREQAARGGYKLEMGVMPAKAEELMQRLAADPDNPSLVLQLAKLHKIERCFPRLMRHFIRLRNMRISDPYLQGQVATLVARAGAPGSGDALPSRTVPPGGRPDPPAWTSVQGQAATLLVQTGADPPRAPGSKGGPHEAVERPRVAGTPASAKPAAARPRASRQQVAPQPTPPDSTTGMPMLYRLGFGLAGLLILAGLLRLVLGH